MRMRKTATTLLLAASVATGMVASTGIASADGSSRVSICGGVGTFKTVNGVRQVQYIVTTDKKKDSAHNAGCFGIAPSGSVWWIPKGGTSWRRMPGNGIGRWAGHSYLGVMCAPGRTCMGPARQIITIRTKAGHYYAQEYVPGKGWNGTWQRNTE